MTIDQLKSNLAGLAVAYPHHSATLGQAIDTINSLLREQDRRKQLDGFVRAEVGEMTTAEQLRDFNENCDFHLTAIREAADELDALTAQLASLKRLLRKHEWVGPTHSSLRGFDLCASCGAYKKDGHTPTCALAAAIKEDGR